ncbi:hypothetical protein JCM9534A_18540 [Catenuloplanes indicus JCM 9534]
MLQRGQPGRGKRDLRIVPQPLPATRVDAVRCGRGLAVVVAGRGGRDGPERDEHTHRRGHVEQHLDRAVRLHHRTVGQRDLKVTTDHRPILPTDPDHDERRPDAQPEHRTGT